MIKTLLHLTAIVVVFLLVGSYQQKDMLPTGGNQPAPYFSLPQLGSGDRISLTSFQGQKVVLYFFAPWCTVCRYSIPNLNKLYQHEQINAVAIALDYDSAAQVNAFVSDLNLAMPILLGDQNLGANYRVSAYPSYYIIDENSNIIARDMGYSSEIGLRLRM